MSEIILHISSGQGPRECQWVVGKVAKTFIKEAAASGLKAHTIEAIGDLAASSLLSISGKGCDAFVQERIGSIKWIGQSPFRPKNKRKNWYVGVSKAPLPNEIPELKESDIVYQAIRASGPGGQHVNKTDSAVRATHAPSGLTCLSQDQRSQFTNKKIARLKLAMILEEQKQIDKAQTKNVQWLQNRELERGNEVRCYEGQKFMLKK